MSWVAVSSGAASRRSRPGGRLAGLRRAARPGGRTRSRRLRWPGRWVANERGTGAMRCGIRLEPAADAALLVGGAAVVPLVEGVGARHHRVEQLVRVLGHLVGLAPQVLGDQGAQQHPREGVLGGRVVEVAAVVDHGAGDLAVAGPGTPVEVVGADAGPAVVDDAGLGVHVDGQALLVAQAEHRDAVAARLEDRAHRQATGRRAGAPRPGRPRVGQHRQHHDQPEVGLVPQRAAKCSPTSSDQRYWSST